MSDSGGGLSLGMGDPLSAVIGGVFGALGAKQQNQFNAQQAWQGFLYQTALQNAQQAYNTNMSNTQYQRGVADLKQAGLNPMLMTGGFSPASASASQGSAPDMGEQTSPISGALSSAKDLGKMLPELQLLKEKTKEAAADADYAKTRAKLLDKVGPDPKAQTIYQTGNTLKDAAPTMLEQGKQLWGAASPYVKKAVEYGSIPGQVAGAMGGSIGKKVRENVYSLKEMGTAAMQKYFPGFGSTPKQKSHIKSEMVSPATQRAAEIMGRPKHTNRAE